MRRRAGITLVLAVLLASFVLAVPAWAQTASDRLAGVVPATIGDLQVEITPMDPSEWITVELGASYDPAVLALQATIDAAGGEDALGAVQLYADAGDAGFVSGEGFALDGVAGSDLLALAVPALLASWGDATQRDEVIANVPVVALRSGSTDAGAPPDAVLFARDAVVWYVFGEGAPFDAGIAALAAAGPPPAPSPTPAPATAVEAVLRDLDAGVVDGPTALRYRALAAFALPGLPDAYASLPAGEDPTLVAELTVAMPDLPADLADLVAPVVARPDDPRSVLSGGQPGAGVRGGALALAAPGTATDPRVAQACLVSGWTSRKATVPVRVWYRCDLGEAGVAGTLSTIEGLWGPMTALMGAPIPDAGRPAEGGDPSIDVYLADDCDSFLARFVCAEGKDLGATRPSPPYSGGPAGTASAYVVVPRSTMANGGPIAKAVVAHELMHVLQAAHAYTARIHGAAWHWFGEASAVWAEHHFVPESRGAGAYAWFKTFQGRPFGLTSPTGSDPYSAWAWPLFMEQEQGAQAIARAWSAMEGAQDWEHLDQAISSVVPYADRFRDFAVRAWNRTLPRTGGGEAITPRFQAFDRGLPDVPPGDGRWSLTDLGVAQESDPPETFTERIPALGMRYRELTLQPAVRRLVVDGRGLRSGDDLDIEALVHVRDTGWERRSLPDGETTFCRDIPADDLDRIILVLANHSATREIAGDLEVRPLEKPCDLWDATMTETVTWNQFGYRGESRATFTGRWQPMDDGIIRCDDGCTAYEPVGTIDWTWSSSVKAAPCSASTSGSLATGDVVVKDDQMLFLQPDGDRVLMWGSGTIFLPTQPCLGWEGDPGPDAFFDVSMPEESVPDGPPAARPPCSDPVWFPAGSEVVEGACWRYDEGGYEDRVEWRMVKVGSQPD